MASIALIIYLAGFGLVVSSQNLSNLAYSKPVTLSSHYEKGHFPGSKAVNRLLSDYACTGKETSPWLRIDLERDCIVQQVEILARADCCPQHLHDLIVKVGHSLDEMQTCGYFTGPAQTKGQEVSVWCPYGTTGRYVEIQIVEGKDNYLTPAEVLVWGTEYLEY